MISTTPSDTEGMLDLDGALTSAIEHWNERTGYWPFLCTGTDEARRYIADPFCSLMDFNGGLLSLTSLYIDVTYTSPGTPYINNFNFKLFPRDAPQRVKPYTYVQFINTPRNVWNGEVEIVGKWGYCLDANLPAGARRGVLALAAIELLPQLREMSSGGLKAWKEGDRDKDFTTIDASIKAWESVVDTAMKAFPRRMRIA
jgi:hypothetical protein